MKMIVGLLGVLVVLYALASNGFTQNTCVSAEQAMSNNTFLQQSYGVQALKGYSAISGFEYGDGRFVRLLAKEVNPNLPSALTCAYWSLKTNYQNIIAKF